MKENKVAIFTSFYEKGKKFYKGKCENCKKDYIGVGKTYCSKKCSMSSQWKNGKAKGLLGKVGKNSLHWKGGKVERNGYIYVYIGSGKYMGEHRIVMQDLLKRKLTINEEVHHINGVKSDNRIENLILVIKSFHFGKIDCPKCEFNFSVK